MKAVILAGGMGTRLSEETHLRPKPMVEIGGKPLLWHIMKIYAANGVNDFIIALGLKSTFSTSTRLIAIYQLILEAEERPFTTASVQKTGRFIWSKQVCIPRLVVG